MKIEKLLSGILEGPGCLLLRRGEREGGRITLRWTMKETE